MDISVKEPGWEPFEYEDVKCEIKTLTASEGLDLQSDLMGAEGENVFSQRIQGYFKKYVRGIEGLTVNGKPIKEPKDLLDPSVGRSEKIEALYIAIIGRFFELNTVSEDERKNLNEPVVEE